MSAERTSSHRIALVGCDAVTVIDVDLTDEEIAFVERLCALSDTASRSECYSTMRLDHPHDQDEPDT